MGVGWIIIMVWLILQFVHYQDMRSLFRVIRMRALSRNQILYPPQTVFDPYKGNYTEREIFCVYKGATVPWIISANYAFSLSLVSQKLFNQ